MSQSPCRTVNRALCYKVLRHRLRRYNSEIVPKETETVENSGCNPSTMKVITGSPWMSISFDTTGPGYRDLGIVQIVKSQTVSFGVAGCTSGGRRGDCSSRTPM